MAKSIYIHIPFCKTKCPYCDFASWEGRENLVDAYFKTLTSEIETKCQSYLSIKPHTQAPLSTIETLFIGGGTPSLIEPEYYEKLFEILKRFFQFSPNCEITFECNPGTANIDFLKGYKELGVNRISIGAQSFNENALDLLGRGHSTNETIEAIELVKEAGFDNFNLDLIYATPNLDLKTWEDSIQKVLSFSPKHISAYSLTIEKNTPFYNTYKDPKLLPSDDETYNMYSKLCKILKEHGFKHYEVSNFAIEGYECKHNLTYWNAKEYYAFGVSAHRYLNGLRTNNDRGLIQYIKNPNVEAIQDLSKQDLFEEVMLKSRLSKGIDFNTIKRMSSKDEKDINLLLENFAEEGYIEKSENKIMLTDKGMFVNNEILLKLA